MKPWKTLTLYFVCMSKHNLLWLNRWLPCIFFLRVFNCIFNNILVFIKNIFFGDKVFLSNLFLYNQVLDAGSEIYWNLEPMRRVTILQYLPKYYAATYYYGIVAYNQSVLLIRLRYRYYYYFFFTDTHLSWGRVIAWHF